MKDTYKKILTLLKKHKNEIVFDVDALQRQAENHLFGIELNEIYGISVDAKNVTSKSWIRIGEYGYIGIFGEKHNRLISWPDVKGQPKNEYLLMYGFPTGAYIFSEDYPTALFNKFWDELKAYNPKFIDTMNHCIYFSLDNAKLIFNDFKPLLKKYYDLNSEDFKARRILKMKEDLAKLEGEITKN